MVIGILIGLIIYAVIIAVVCYVINFALVSLLKAPVAVTTAVYIVGLLVFLARLVDVLPALGVPTS